MTTDFLAKVWRDPVGSKVIAAGILAIGATVIGLVLGGTVSGWRFNSAFRAIPSTILLTSGGVLLVLSIFLISKGWGALGQAVEWDFESHLGMSTGGSEVQDVHVGSLQFSGTNKKKEPIQVVSGFVRSLVTGDRFPVLLNHNGNPIPIERLKAVPPEAQFQLVVPFLRDVHSAGMPYRDFISKLADFELVMETDGYKERFTFSRAANLEAIERFVATLPRKKPAVLLKD